MTDRCLALTALALAVSVALGSGAARAARPLGERPPAPPRNVIVFVADGLRRGSVNPTDAPAMFRLRRAGVDFENSHSLFPTVTTANASAIATGHQLGDTGDFANALYTGFPIFDDGRLTGRVAGSVTPFLESDLVLADLTGRYADGNYLDEASLLALARRHGYQTAAIGKLGPVAIQDVSELVPRHGAIPPGDTVVVDDSTGSAAGVPLAPGFSAALAAAGLPTEAPHREQPAGTVSVPGTTQANLAQQRYFVDVTTRVVLPAFRSSGRPFVLVFWSRDPDGSQHNQGDSLNRLVPGINGATSRAGIANADANLAQILDWLAANPEIGTHTDVVLTSDHGFATISKHELDGTGRVSRAWAAGFEYPEVVRGWLPPGFLALDLAHALELPLYDPESQVSIDGELRYEPVDPTQAPTATQRQYPSAGNALIGGRGAVGGPTDAQVIVAANGGSDLIYVPDHDAARVRRLVGFLARQDYVGGLFVDSRYGRLPGALPLRAIGLEGDARTPRPAIVVSFRSFPLDPADPLQTAVQIADTPLQEGQGMHGALSRDNTLNNMAALGPDFKRGYVDPDPVSNADLVPTLAHALGWDLPSHGRLGGRIVAEALRGGPPRLPFAHRVETSPAAAVRDGHRGAATRLEYQVAGGKRYLDAACFAAPANADVGPVSAIPAEDRDRKPPANRASP
jgi:arylsulfatase A-like enzyme